MMKYLLPVCIVLPIAVSGCSVSSEDRCPNGYEYLEDEMLCYLIEDTSTSTDDTGEIDSGDTDSGMDTGTDETGFGALCNDTLPCEFEADYCYGMPGGNGTCTYQDCEPGQCPTGYKCCDCTDVFGMPIVCLSDTDASDGFIGSQCTGCE